MCVARAPIVAFNVGFVELSKNSVTSPLKYNPFHCEKRLSEAMDPTFKIAKWLRDDAILAAVRKGRLIEVKEIHECLTKAAEAMGRWQALIEATAGVWREKHSDAPPFASTTPSDVIKLVEDIRRCIETEHPDMEQETGTHVSGDVATNRKRPRGTNETMVKSLIAELEAIKAIDSSDQVHTKILQLDGVIDDLNDDVIESDDIKKRLQEVIRMLIADFQANDHKAELVPKTHDH